MTIKQKRNLLIFVIFPVGELLIGYLGIKIHPMIAIVGGFLYMGILSLVGLHIRCPRCQEPVSFSQRQFGAIKLKMPAVFTPKSCVFCGFKFD